MYKEGWENVSVTRNFQSCLSFSQKVHSSGSRCNYTIQLLELHNHIFYIYIINIFLLFIGKKQKEDAGLLSILYF